MNCRVCGKEIYFYTGPIRSYCFHKSGRVSKETLTQLVGSPYLQNPHLCKSQQSVERRALEKSCRAELMDKLPKKKGK